MKRKTIEALKAIRADVEVYQSPLEVMNNIRKILDTLIANEEQEDLDSITEQPEELTEEEVRELLGKSPSEVRRAQEKSR